MTIRVAAIEVGHWHAVHDAAYLRHLSAMSDVALVGLQDSDAGLVKKRAAEAGNPPIFTDYHQMLNETRPDFVLALGRLGRRPRSRTICSIGACRSSHGEADGDQRRGSAVRGGQGRPAQGLRRRPALPALPAFRHPRPPVAGRGTLRAALPHLRAPEPSRACAVPGLGQPVDARSGRGGGRLSSQPGAARPRHVPVPHRGGGAGDRRADQPPSARRARRGLRLRRCCARRAGSWARSRSATGFPRWAPTGNGRSPGATPSSR